VEDLFAEFAATGSAMGVVKAFAATGRLFPQRRWGGAWDGQIKWGKLTHSRVLQAVKNPVYAGAYAYGRSYDARTVRPDGTVAATRVKRPRAEWTVLTQDHHPGYITWQQFVGIETKLVANHTKAGFRPPREGPALCQGIIFCGICGGRMTTRYGDGGRVQYRHDARSGDIKTVPEAPVLVRYADDLLALCHTREQAQEVKDRLAQWLEPRGLRFNEAKTRIVTLTQSADFLGFNIRRYPSGKLLIKTSKAAITRARQRLSDTMRRQRGANASAVNRALNPLVRGVGRLLPDGGVQRGVPIVGRTRVETGLQVGQLHTPEETEAVDHRPLLRPVQPVPARPLGVR
jgi:hypothetical protein